MADMMLPHVQIVMNSRGQARMVIVDGRELSVRRVATEWKAGDPTVEVVFTIDAAAVETRIDPTLDSRP